MLTPVLCCLIVINALPQSVILNPIESDDDDDVINLTHLGERLFGNENFRFAKELNGDNPEELGPYLEGDLLVPQIGRNGMKDASLKWKNGTVPYVIRGRYSANEIKVIQNAINQYHRNTCIKFVNRRATDIDYIVIDNAQSGCWSSVGRIGGEQRVNLQSPGCVTKLGTVIHEFLHVLGFQHEHTREERDKFVTIVERNIRDGYEVNFRKAAPGETSGFGVGYDYGSVMHYSANAFSKNGKPTIETKTKTNEKMGQREGFSKKDIEKVNKMYKCKKTTADVEPSIMTSTIEPPPSSGSFLGNIFQAIFPSSNMDEEEMENH